MAWGTLFDKTVWTSSHLVLLHFLQFVRFFNLEINNSFNRHIASLHFNLFLYLEELNS